MSKLSIAGYGDELTVNGIRIGDLSPADHEAIENDKGGRNYEPLEWSYPMYGIHLLWCAVNRIRKRYVLLLKKTSLTVFVVTPLSTKGS